VCRLSTTLLFLNLQSTYSVSNVAMDSIFRAIHTLLPKPNSMPTSRDDAAKLLSKLGLECEVIHMCEKGCKLFRGDDLKDATQCPTCKSPRYRDDTIGEKIPRKVQIVAIALSLVFSVSIHLICYYTLILIYEW
jgi:predicted Zn-ribbon and HTH transcriptional regulator